MPGACHGLEKRLIQKVSLLLLVLMGLSALGMPVMRASVAAPDVVTFPVTSPLDDIDDNPGNGTCHTSLIGPAAGLCTLRAAVMEANRASGAGATIMLPAGIYSLTIPAAGIGGDANGSLDLTTPSSGNPLISIVGAERTQRLSTATRSTGCSPFTRTAPPASAVSASGMAM